jgi:hypothetical protein
MTKRGPVPPIVGVCTSRVTPVMSGVYTKPGERLAAASACAGITKRGPVPPIVGVAGDRNLDNCWFRTYELLTGKSMSAVGELVRGKRSPTPNVGVRGTTMPFATAAGNATLHSPVAADGLLKRVGGSSNMGGCTEPLRAASKTCRSHRAHHRDPPRKQRRKEKPSTGSINAHKGERGAVLLKGHAAAAAKSV